jgi:Bardet-Biedl syndrome 1 protein
MNNNIILNPAVILTLNHINYLLTITTGPPLDISKEEEKIWSDFSAGLIDATSTLRSLEDLRDKVMNIKLTSRTLELLSLGNNTTSSSNQTASNANTNNNGVYSNEATRLEFIESYKEIPLSSHTLITCMEVLKKESEEADALNLLVIGTESGFIYILPKDPNNSEFLSKVLLPSIPVMMCITGAYDTEYRICVSCRDGKIYYIKNGDSRNSIVLSGSVNDLGSLPVSIARLDKNIWVATMDRNLSCYSLRGKKSVSILFNEDITEICSIDLKRSKYSNLMMVAFVSGE